MRWNIPSADLVLFLFERSGRMGKVLIWFVIIISTVVDGLGLHGYDTAHG